MTGAIRLPFERVRAPLAVLLGALAKIRAGLDEVVRLFVALEIPRAFEAFSTLVASDSSCRLGCVPGFWLPRRRRLLNGVAGDG